MDAKGKYQQETLGTNQERSSSILDQIKTALLPHCNVSQLRQAGLWGIVIVPLALTTKMHGRGHFRPGLPGRWPMKCPIVPTLVMKIETIFNATVNHCHVLTVSL